MCLPFCRRQTRGGAGPGPVTVDRAVVYFGTTDWRRFGKRPTSLKGRLRTWSLNDGIAEDMEGSCMGLFSFGYGNRIIPLSPGIGGIGCDIVSVGVRKVKPCSGRF